MAVFVREDLSCRCVEQSGRSLIYELRPEFMLALIRIGTRRVLVCVVYNPPKAGFWSDVEEALLNCPVAYDHLILTGDLNIDWSSPSTSRAILDDFFRAFDVEPLRFGPTTGLATQRLPSTTCARVASRSTGPNR